MMHDTRVQEMNHQVHEISVSSRGHDMANTLSGHPNALKTKKQTKNTETKTSVVR